MNGSRTTDTGQRQALSRRLRAALLAVPLALFTLALSLLALPPGAAQAHGTACQRLDVRVALSPGETVRHRVAGWLCRPSRSTSTVQVLLSGFTYDHTYWDQPGGGRSYVQAALNTGAAVFNIDRVGVGLSDRPPADQVTAGSEAFVAHQLVQQLRREHGFRRVVGVGHSYGSAVWMVEAAGHHDVDALVLTGYLHQPNPVQVAKIGAGLYPADQDEAFAGERIPDGYVTTRPGSRAGAFYYVPGAAAGALARDERTKATGTAGQRATMNLARDPFYSEHITVPVLLVVGDHDTLSCDGTALLCSSAAQICARERGFYPPGSLVSAAVIPDAGHSINGHRTAPAAFAVVNAWAWMATSGLAPFWPGCPS